MRLKYLKNMVNLNLDHEKCVGCGFCIDVCPHGVLKLENGKVYIAEKDYCIECGACAKNCPTEAITVESGVG
ncbi:mercury methylation ferredoxin HgcB [Wukongibacter baidiensis]|uniref:mercury methylation ferredoxin HgcB n=1 Tax=Wukongibacter baidiensis TaxID=1723361 RepID=UPI003D7F4853